MGRQGLEEEEEKKSGFYLRFQLKAKLYSVWRPFLIGLEKDLCGFLSLFLALQTLIDMSSSPIQRRGKRSEKDYFKIQNWYLSRAVFQADS